jgi:hypothetical protein
LTIEQDSASGTVKDTKAVCESHSFPSSNLGRGCGGFTGSRAVNVLASGGVYLRRPDRRHKSKKKGQEPINIFFIDY